MDVTPKQRRRWDRLHQMRVTHDWAVFFFTLASWAIALSLLAFKIDSADAYSNFVSFVVAYPTLNIFFAAFMKHADANNNYSDTSRLFLIITIIHAVILGIIFLGWAFFSYFGCVVAAASFCVGLPWQYWFHVIPVWISFVLLVVELALFDQIRRQVKKFQNTNPTADQYAKLIVQKDGSIHSIGVPRISKFA
jgi:hypothetical protein